MLFIILFLSGIAIILIGEAICASTIIDGAVYKTGKIVRIIGWSVFWLSFVLFVPLNTKLK